MHGYGAKNLAESWRTVRKNTIQIAEDIPEDQYGFRATVDTMTVSEMLAHLATGTYWAEQAHFVESVDDISVEKFGEWFGEIGKMGVALSDKHAILDSLRTRGEAFAVQLEAMTDPQLEEMVSLPGGSKSRFEMLLGVKEHEMHHRAQLMLLERMIGIVPHLTRARQASA